MRALVLGSGGREHALVWALARSPEVEEVVCAPGSDGISGDATVLPIELSDSDAVLTLARRAEVGLVVVGPENPLVDGIADRLRAEGISVFGPSAEAARLEGSKAFAKEFMARHQIPTAAYRVFDAADDAQRYAEQQAGPLVVKADGLAAGKGVFVCAGFEDARRAIDEIMRDARFGSAGARVVIEERLVGEEASYYAISDGQDFICLPPAQDFKRTLDGDRGENTGGMGAYSPAAVVDTAVERKVVERIVRPTLDGMRAEGWPYRGVLYVGLMISGGEPRVVEFNARFGDPETQPILFRLESDLVPVLRAAASEGLSTLDDRQRTLRFAGASVCVVMASEGYPRDYPRGLTIDGLGGLDELADVKVFHAGTRMEAGGWCTAGGRVLAVTARASTLPVARERAYRAVQAISFKGGHYRRDIAERAVRELVR